MLPRGMAAGHDQRVSARARARAEALIRASQRTHDRPSCWRACSDRLSSSDSPCFWRVRQHLRLERHHRRRRRAGADRRGDHRRPLAGGARRADRRRRCSSSRRPARRARAGARRRPGRAALDARAVRRGRRVRQPAPQPVRERSTSWSTPATPPQRSEQASLRLGAFSRALAGARTTADVARAVADEGAAACGARAATVLAPVAEPGSLRRRGRQPAARRADATGARGLHGRPADRRHAGAARAAAGRRPRPRRDPPPLPRLRRILGRRADRGDRGAAARVRRAAGRDHVLVRASSRGRRRPARVLPGAGTRGRARRSSALACSRPARRAASGWRRWSRPRRCRCSRSTSGV